MVDRQARQLEPGCPELRLEAEPPCGPLSRRPGRGEHDQDDDGDLAPEDFCGGQGRIPRCKCSQGRWPIARIARRSTAGSRVRRCWRMKTRERRWLIKAPFGLHPRVGTVPTVAARFSPPPKRLTPTIAHTRQRWRKPVTPLPGDPP